MLRRALRCRPDHGPLRSRNVSSPTSSYISRQTLLCCPKGYSLLSSRIPRLVETLRLRECEEHKALYRAPRGRRPCTSCGSTSTCTSRRRPSTPRRSVRCFLASSVAEGRVRYAEARRRRECARTGARDPPATGVPGTREASRIPCCRKLERRHYSYRASGWQK